MHFIKLQYDCNIYSIEVKLLNHQTILDKDKFLSFNQLNSI